MGMSSRNRVDEMCFPDITQQQHEEIINSQTNQLFHLFRKHISPHTSGPDEIFQISTTNNSIPVGTKRHQQIYLFTINKIIRPVFAICGQV
jgi:hypothetical protein